jgi:hypothetical protein
LKKLLVGLGILAGICVAYIAIHLALIEIGKDIVVLHKPTGDGSLTRARLWIVEEGGRTWLHHGYADSAWIQALETDPVVAIERGGETLKYRATPDPAADPQVHRLLRKKYGLADRLVRFWAGTDTDPGVATGGTCRAVPVRLEPL